MPRNNYSGDKFSTIDLKKPKHFVLSKARSIYDQTFERIAMHSKIDCIKVFNDITSASAAIKRFTFINNALLYF